MAHIGGKDKFKQKEFNFGFRKCCDPCDTCCTAFWCPCILVNRTSDLIDFLQELKKNPSPSNPTLTKSPRSCGCAGFGFCMLTTCGGWGSIITCLQRGDIRTNNDMNDGNRCDDFVRNFCCPCCSIVQQYKEVEKRWEVITDHYKPQDQMHAGQKTGA